MDLEKVGTYLTEIRKYYKLTQDELANKMDVSRQAVSKWETGASLPDIDVLLKLSNMYDVGV